MKSRTEQIIVSPNSMTLETLADGVKHWGQCLCPFCNQPNIVAGPYKGAGLAWVFEGCGHHMGTAATEKAYEISILFRGNRLYSEIECEPDADHPETPDSGHGTNGEY